MAHAFVQQCWPIMSYWFAVTTSYALVRSVLWWQTTRSAEAFSAVPDINTPTLLQMSPSYPSIIDWIPHAGIRELIIPNYDSYDVDQVICDMTDAYVVEGEDPSDWSSGDSFNLMDMVQRSLHSGVELGRSGDKSSNPTLRITSLLTKAATNLGREPGTNQIHRFKVDPSFFVKYPGLYDPNAVAKNTVPRTFGASRMQGPLPLSIQSIRHYVDLLS